MKAFSDEIVIQVKITNCYPRNWQFLGSRKDWSQIIIQGVVYIGTKSDGEISLWVVSRK